MKKLAMRVARRVMPHTVDRVAARVYATRWRVDEAEGTMRALGERMVVLENRIVDLQEEVDEARRDSLRIAQLTDAVEQRLLE